MPSFGPISSHPVSGLFSAKEREDVSASMDAAIAHINIKAMAGLFSWKHGDNVYAVTGTTD